MLPDPLLLRGTAASLAAAADDLGTRGAVLGRAREATRWAGPLCDAVDRELADAQAGAATGTAGLLAAAAHLRAVATAVEQTGEAARRWHAAAAEDLQRRLAVLPPGPEQAAARQELARLPPGDDPAWATRASATSPRPPEVPRVPAGPSRVSPPGTVAAEPGDLRVLAAHALALGDGVGAALLPLRRAAGLDAAGLDAWGLGGRSTAVWLAGQQGLLAPVEERLRSPARRTALLADLLERAGSGLLLDPRLPAAVAALDACAGSAPGAPPGPTPALAWLADVVPGEPVPVRAPGQADLPSGPLGPLDLVDLLLGLWQVPVSLAERAAGHVRALVHEARRLGDLARGLSGPAAAAQRRAAQALLREARSAREVAARLERLAARTHVPGWLRRASTTPVAPGRWLSTVSRVGAVGGVLGLVLDVRAGVPLPVALAKAAGALAAAAVATLLLAGALAALPALTAIVLEIVVVSAAAVAGAALVGFVLPRLGRALSALVGAAGRALRGGALRLRLVAERAQRGWYGVARVAGHGARGLGSALRHGVRAVGHAVPGLGRRLLPDGRVAGARVRGGGGGLTRIVRVAGTRGRGVGGGPRPGVRVAGRAPRQTASGRRGTRGSPRVIAVTGVLGSSA